LAEVAGMNRGTPPGSDKATFEDLAFKNGVRLTPQDADAVIRSLARIQSAAASLLQAPALDATIEQFYRLLEVDAAEDAGR
jgi:hypothetical protein